jgi:hypothetical protein
MAQMIASTRTVVACGGSHHFLKNKEGEWECSRGCGEVRNKHGLTAKHSAVRKQPRKPLR